MVQEHARVHHGINGSPVCQWRGPKLAAAGFEDNATVARSVCHWGCLVGECGSRVLPAQRPAPSVCV